MTEQPLQPIDPGTIHPALRDALLTREPLLWAFDNDGQMREQVRQLDVVLHALAKHMPDRWLADRLLADPTILPTDDALVQRRYEQERRLRELTMRLTGVPDVHLDDQGRGLVPPQVVAQPVVSAVEPCPECRASKCNNCTGQTLDASDELVPCPCTHDGRGVLVMPTEHFGAEQVQCMKLGDPEHRGTHPQLGSCILPLPPSSGGWAQ